MSSLSLDKQAAAVSRQLKRYRSQGTESNTQSLQHEESTRPNDRSETSLSPSLTQAQSSTPSRPQWRRYISKITLVLWDQWFLFALGFFIILASQIQVPSSQQEVKETVVTYCCVALIFFITGCTLPTKILISNSSRWKIHIFVQLQSFLLTSAIVFAFVSLCATNDKFMDPGLLVGMIFTGCVPTTISSNVIMTKQARGNQALTAVESTLGNFLGPFISPLMVIMYTSTGAWYTRIVPSIEPSGYGELYRRVFMQLGLSLFLPLVCAVRPINYAKS